MITYVTSDGKKFNIHADAQKHEAELLANQKSEAAKKAWLAEKKIAYSQLVQKITEVQNAIKAYNQKYYDTISFNVKLQFNENTSGYSDDKTETETKPQKKNTFTINTRFDSDEQAKSLNELINSLCRF